MQTRFPLKNNQRHRQKNKESQHQRALPAFYSERIGAHILGQRQCRGKLGKFSRL